MGVVSNVILKTREISSLGYDEILDPGEDLFSENVVCGYSVNFPIAKTCHPTKVCEKTCYFAKGGNSWGPALKKQIRVYNLFDQRPIEAAQRLAAEYHKKGCDFLRINGGGDLFEGSVKAINYLVKNHPEITLWIVTRKLKVAAMVEYCPNKHIHISIDSSSVGKIEKYRAMEKASENYFFRTKQSQKNTSQKS